MNGRDQEQDIEKYQRRLNELYRTRKNIVEGIKDLRRKQRLAADRPRLPAPMPSKSSLQARPSGEELPKSAQSLDHPHLDTQQEEIKKVLEAQSGLRDRNRRLLGGLNKHLQKAESRLSEQSTKARSKQSIEQRVLQKEREQAEEFEQQKRRQMELQLERLELAKENNSKEMLATENIILKNKFLAYVSDLEQCLFTQTQPKLAWKTNSQAPPQVLVKMQEKNKELLQKMLNETLQKVSNYSQAFDFNTYRIENEQQFYKNYLDNYFASKLNFITTATQPPVQWLPKQHNNSTKQQLASSIASAQQLRASIAQECEAFYKRFQKEAAIADQHEHEHSEDSESEH